MITKEEFIEARACGDTKRIEEYAVQLQETLDRLIAPYLKGWEFEIKVPKWEPKQYRFIGTQDQVVQFKYVLDDKNIQCAYQPQPLHSDFDPMVGQKFELITAYQIKTEQDWNDLEGLKLYVLEKYPSR